MGQAGKHGLIDVARWMPAIRRQARIVVAHQELEQRRKTLQRPEDVERVIVVQSLLHPSLNRRALERTEDCLSAHQDKA